MAVIGLSTIATWIVAAVSCSKVVKSNGERATSIAIVIVGRVITEEQYWSKQWEINKCNDSF